MAKATDCQGRITWERNNWLASPREGGGTRQGESLHAAPPPRPFGIKNRNWSCGLEKVCCSLDPLALLRDGGRMQCILVNMGIDEVQFTTKLGEKREIQLKNIFKRVEFRFISCC